DAHGTDYTPFQPLPRFYNPPPFSRRLNSKFSTPHISSSCDFRASMLKEPSMDNASLRSQVTRWLPWISGAAGLLYIAMRLYWIRHRYFMVDETEHLHAAWCMAQGQIPYKDFFEHHMPLIWIILQPVVRLWTDPVQALYAGRGLMLAFWFSILALYTAYGKRDWDVSERIIAAFIFCSFTTFARHAYEMRPDVPASLLLAASFVLGLRFNSRWVDAGLCA